MFPDKHRLFSFDVNFVHCSLPPPQGILSRVNKRSGSKLLHCFFMHLLLVQHFRGQFKVGIQIVQKENLPEKSDNTFEMLQLDLSFFISTFPPAPCLADSDSNFANSISRFLSEETHLWLLLISTQSKLTLSCSRYWAAESTSPHTTPSAVVQFLCSAHLKICFCFRKSHTCVSKWLFTNWRTESSKDCILSEIKESVCDLPIDQAYFAGSSTQRTSKSGKRTRMMVASLPSAICNHALPKNKLKIEKNWNLWSAWKMKGVKDPLHFSCTWQIPIFFNFQFIFW